MGVYWKEEWISKFMGFQLYEVASPVGSGEAVHRTS